MLHEAVNDVCIVRDGVHPRALRYLRKPEEEVLILTAGMTILRFIMVAKEQTAPTGSTSKILAMNILYAFSWRASSPAIVPQMWWSISSPARRASVATFLWEIFVARSWNEV